MTTFYANFLEAAAAIDQKSGGFRAKVGIILGSGLGPLADAIENPIRIPYQDIPHFPVSRVAGHSGALILGKLNGVPVVCLSGRVHLYEGTSTDNIKMLVRMLKQLGCHTMLVTNAAGSLRKEVPAGEVCLITDHINFTQINPVVGLNDDEFGPRFYPMTDAYDPAWRAKLLTLAKEINIPLYQGVYLAALGPAFETPAEIKAFRTLGTDLVGMSTVPEVLVARHCGLRVIGITAVTNLSADLNEEVLSHEQTLRGAKMSEEKLLKLVRAFFEKYATELVR